MELPFVVEESDVKKFFAKCSGGVKRLEMFVIFFFIIICI